MNEDDKAGYLRTLRAEEAAGLQAIAFWEQQAQFTRPGWIGLHLDGLKRQLEVTREAIRAVDVKGA